MELERSLVGKPEASLRKQEIGSYLSTKERFKADKTFCKGEKHLPTVRWTNPEIPAHRR
jgi:hypothetical protein